MEKHEQHERVNSLYISTLLGNTVPLTLVHAGKYNKVDK